jgi:hypothetical protein
MAWEVSMSLQPNREIDAMENRATDYW